MTGTTVKNGEDSHVKWLRAAGAFLVLAYAGAVQILPNSKSMMTIMMTSPSRH
jgi:hypothetical protein